MKKCRYCGKNVNSSYEFCSSECENNYRTSAEKVFPFTTLETIGILGYKKSKIAGRISGLALITIGIWFKFFL